MMYTHHIYIYNNNNNKNNKYSSSTCVLTYLFRVLECRRTD